MSRSEPSPLPRLVPVALDDEGQLQRETATLARLREILADKEAELARMNAELGDFTARYVDEVGNLVVERDRLEAEVAALTYERERTASARQGADAARARADASASEAHYESDVSERVVGDEDLQRLYREAAKLMHPDLATDEEARRFRTVAMAEANAAYRAGDRHRLEELVREWRNRPESVVGDDAVARLERIRRQIRQVQARLDALGAEISRLRASDLYRLMLECRRLSGRGRDLLAEMAKRVGEDLEIAQHRLASMRAP